MIGLARVGSSAEIVTLAEAKLQCRVDHDDDDTLIAAFISAACDVVAQGSGLVLGEEVWQFKTGPTFGPLSLPKSPAVALISISYLDPALEPQVAEVADFEVFIDDPISWVQPRSGKAWPICASRPDAITITFSAGPETPLAGLRVAALLLVSYWYDNRSEVSVSGVALEMPASVQSLINLHRIGWIKA